MGGGLYVNSLVVEFNSSFLGVQGSSPNWEIQLPRLGMKDPRPGMGWRIQEYLWNNSVRVRAFKACIEQLLITSNGSGGCGTNNGKSECSQRSIKEYKFYCSSHGFNISHDSKSVRTSNQDTSKKPPTRTKWVEIHAGMICSCNGETSAVDSSVRHVLQVQTDGVGARTYFYWITTIVKISCSVIKKVLSWVTLIISTAKPRSLSTKTTLSTSKAHQKRCWPSPSIINIETNTTNRQGESWIQGPPIHFFRCPTKAPTNKLITNKWLSGVQTDPLWDQLQQMN